MPVSVEVDTQFGCPPHSKLAGPFAAVLKLAHANYYPEEVLTLRFEGLGATDTAKKPGTGISGYGVG